MYREVEMINLNAPILPDSVYVDGYNDWPKIWILLVAIIIIIAIDRFGGKLR